MTIVWMIVMGAIILAFLFGSVYVFTKPPGGKPLEAEEAESAEDTSEGVD